MNEAERWRYKYREFQQEQENALATAQSRIRALEAENREILSDCREANAALDKAEARVRELEARPEDGHHSYHCEVCDWWLSRAEKAEAEVERLRHLGGAPPGMSPSPPASFFCGICDVWFDDYADLQNHAKHEAAARKERAP